MIAKLIVVWTIDLFLLVSMAVIRVSTSGPERDRALLQLGVLRALLRQV